MLRRKLLQSPPVIVSYQTAATIVKGYPADFAVRLFAPLIDSTFILLFFSKTGPTILIKFSQSVREAEGTKI